MSNEQPGQTPAPDDDATRASGTPTGADRPRPAYGEYAPTPAGGAPAPSEQQPVAPGAPQGTPYGAPQQGAPYGAPQQGTPASSPTTGAPGPKGIGAFAGEGHPQTLATFTRYEDAQSAVDLLSDEGFPVESVSIVGHDIRTVENVAGRLTTGKAAARGAAGGAWFGLLLGLLFSIFAPGVAFIGVLLIALGAGALWGALWGAVGHAATRGRRDFASVKTMEAGRYEVLVRGELSARAHQVLAQGRKVG
jgi:hypothetical protein